MRRSAYTNKTAIKTAIRTAILFLCIDGPPPPLFYVAGYLYNPPLIYRCTFQKVVLTSEYIFYFFWSVNQWSTAWLDLRKLLFIYLKLWNPPLTSQSKKMFPLKHC